MSIFSDIKTTITSPFTEKLDVLHLFLLVGLVMVFIGLWAFVISHAKAAAMEVV